MLSRRALLLALTSAIAAGCAQVPATPSATPTAAAPGATPPPPPTPTSVPTATAAPTLAPTSPPTATATTLPPEPTATPQPAPEPAPPPPLASLAIMIENQADARPQTGLTHADVVYEALAEGGITRFIALYLTGDASTVGPVRSLRHYFAFFAAEYGADVVHIGASPEGYAWRDALHMGHLDETFGEPGIWRVGTRPPPHNAYTDTAADRRFLEQRGRQQNHSWGPLLFSDDAPMGELPATNVSLRFRPWAYRVDYSWDGDASCYLRNMEGAPHRDAATGEQIAPSSVVVQFAEVDPIVGDPKLRLDVNLAGAGGPLVVFSGGTRRDGFWSKTDPGSASVWLDVGGSPMVLPPGAVWVEVVPLDSPLAAS